MSTDFEGDALAILHQALGPSAQFRDGQLEAIKSLVQDRTRLLVVQRTGWGKSAVYFVATRLLRNAGVGTTIIVSPLLALMRDQIHAASRLHLNAVTINSSNKEDWEQVKDDLLADSSRSPAGIPRTIQQCRVQGRAPWAAGCQCGASGDRRGALHKRLGT